MFKYRNRETPARENIAQIEARWKGEIRRDEGGRTKVESFLTQL
jgi:hypothetical protein